MAVNLPYQSQDAGIPYQWADTINPADKDLFSGDLPPKMTEDLIFKASQTIEARTVVGLDNNDQVVPAVLGTTAAIGVTAHKVVAGVGQNPGGAVYRAGCFNPDALIWDATYDTDAKKLNAFHGAATPTNILVRKVQKGAKL